MLYVSSVSQQDHHSATLSLSIASMTNDMGEQTTDIINNNNHHEQPEEPIGCGKMASVAKRSSEELAQLYKLGSLDLSSLSNDEIIGLMISRQVPVHKLESVLGKVNARRCVEIRRQYYIRELELLDQLDGSQSVEASSGLPEDKTYSAQEAECGNARKSQSTNVKNQIPYLRAPRANVLKVAQSIDFDYSRVVGACCENVIGCVRLPVGLVGPLKLDGQNIYVPLATTEGCLVASTSRGMSALARSGGVCSRIAKNSMTRAPIVRFQDAELRDALNQRNRAIDWLEDPVNRQKIMTAFRSTSRHTQLIDYTVHPIGRELHIRFEARTGDAMGMNMCSKGAEMALKEMQKVFPTMDILTLSGNMCTDKKPSAINWVNGRGKSVECNAVLPAEVVEKVFRVPVDSLIEVWMKKVMVGGAMAGSVGGFNCHAANIVAAIFIATGQDAAQVVSSSNCLLTLEKDSKGSLAVHCSMPSVECGTVGGGTVLQDQSSYLQLMGIKGSSPTQQSVNKTLAQRQGSSNEISDSQLYDPKNQDTTLNSQHLPSSGYYVDTDSDSNACKLAKIICSTVMAAELSLLASLTEGTLVKSHMTHNRSTQPCKVV